MKPIFPVFRVASSLTAAVLVSACGGGGGSSGASNVAAPVQQPPVQASADADLALPAGCTVHVVVDSRAVAGKSVAASVLSCGAPFADVVWSQTGGAAVELLATRSPTVVFEPGAAGTVSLRADVTLADGRTTSASANVVVAARPAGSYITVRADHAVRPEENTSVRAWPVLAAGENIRSITWTQVAGPEVARNTDDPSVLIFKAPAAASDTALRFRATLTTNTGATDSDDVTITLDRQSAPSADAIFDSAARVHPYRQAARYASALARCTYSTGLYYKRDGENNLCPSTTLPLLQSEVGVNAIPSIEQVMGRVLVSHDFLGANFENFLATQDPHGDFRRLLGGVSAIVIGSHVRPSFYTAATGAIYLDANYLWRNAAQRDVVTEVADYRSDFGNSLNFTPLGRKVRNNADARSYFSPYERITRTSAEMVSDLGGLLYHELAHASDFVPPDQRNLDGSLSIYGNLVQRLRNKQFPSDVLADRYPLESAQMKGLGQVLYLGAPANDTQKSYTAEQVGQFFGADVANDPYSYAINGSDSSREDLAMLFEEFMLSYRHGVQFDVMYTNPYRNGMTADQLFVAWGQRGRIAEPRIKPRIKLVLQQIAPWIDPNAVDTLPAPVMLTRGASYEQSLVVMGQPGPVLSPQALLRAQMPAERADRLRHALQRGQHLRR